MLKNTVWDFKNDFTVEEAARLWFDIDPNEDETKIPNEVMLKIKAMRSILNEAVAMQEIEDVIHDFDGIHAISRKGLRAYAKKIKQRPLFLFPKKMKKSLVQSDEGAQYVFKKTGPGWKIIFDGNPIEPLKGKGFDYMHYCIERAPKEFDNIDLDRPINAGMIGNLKFMEEKSQNFQFGRVVSPGPLQYKADAKTLTAVRELRDRLKQNQKNREEAEKENDRICIQEIDKDTKKIEEYLKEAQFGGRSKPFKNEVTKISHKVNKAIARALESLRRCDEKAYEHFHDAFKPIHSSSKKYNPAINTPWILS